MNAHQHLQAAIDCLAERGKQYDNEAGESAAQAAPSGCDEAMPSPDVWEAGEARMDVVGMNGNDGTHYPEAGFK